MRRIVQFLTGNCHFFDVALTDGQYSIMRDLTIGLGFSRPSFMGFRGGYPLYLAFSRPSAGMSIVQLSEGIRPPNLDYLWTMS